MKVMAAVNGLITSEVAALYALRYATVHGYVLVLLHVNNAVDSLDDVARSMAVIEEVAELDDIATERVFLEGDPVRAIRKFLDGNRIDTMFCSTSRRPGVFKKSLHEQLIRLPLSADLAVVRVVRLETPYSVKNMVLAVQEDRLSVKKFTLFASFAKAYEASAEIYSVTVVDSGKLAELDIPLTRSMLRKINDRLSHYIKLARFMGLPLRIKHAVARNEVDQVLHHLSHHDFQLLLVGGRRLSLLFRLFRRKPIERLFHETPINTIVFYGRSNG